ncbi:hypothetical protein AK812_SmicGene7119 [Symbiodinium microadriaticum]|uniref:Uncharacterized protein n=1 Tax=Symbiodinium microadriaticum TaxID=2951 RepID=A0A1Q9EPA4_SYMMI|nr:hypothetical protein AK812_SmicGene7119 [Symbiodinium microadriaticum]CAE7625022.1 unnamed protein product [Symbiodinium sp. KB8]
MEASLAEQAQQLHERLLNAKGSANIVFAQVEAEAECRESRSRNETNARDDEIARLKSDMQEMMRIQQQRRSKEKEKQEEQEEAASSAAGGFGGRFHVLVWLCDVTPARRGRTPQLRLSASEWPKSLVSDCEKRCGIDGVHVYGTRASIISIIWSIGRRREYAATKRGMGGSRDTSSSEISGLLDGCSRASASIMSISWALSPL